MGGLICIIIFIGIMMGDKRDRRHSDLIRWLILGSIGLGILGTILSSPIGILALVAAGIYLFKRYQDKQSLDNRSKDNQRTYDRNTNQRTYDRGGSQQPGYSSQNYKEGDIYEGGSQTSQNGGSYYKPTGSQQSTSYKKPADRNMHGHTTLPKRAAKRRKIIEQFNKRYDLCLTDEQMDSIVNSSYMSESWRRELEAMQERYDHVTHWLCGGKDWLRTYMYVFRIQEITSDIQAQEEICKFSFETIFQYVDTLGSYGLSDKIRMVNDKYFTNFDDITFMTAYRFLESKGLEHDLTTADVPTYREQSEADRLTEQYLEV